MVLSWSEVLSVLLLCVLFGFGFWWAFRQSRQRHWNVNTSPETERIIHNLSASASQSSQSSLTSSSTTTIGTKKAKRLERKTQRREQLAHLRSIWQREEEASQLAWELDQECREQDRLQSAEELAEIRLRKEREAQQKAKMEFERVEKQKKQDVYLLGRIGTKAICKLSVQEYGEDCLRRLESAGEFKVIWPDSTPTASNKDEEKCVLVVRDGELENLVRLLVDEHSSEGKCRIEEFVDLALLKSSQNAN